MNFEERIRRDWQDDEPVASVCLALVHELRLRPALDHYSFSQLHEWSRTDNLQSLARAVVYLSSPSLDVLRTSIMYEDDGNLLELPREEVLQFERGMDVVHPRSGEKVHRSDLVVAFEPGGLLRQADRR